MIQKLLKQMVHAQPILAYRIVLLMFRIYSLIPMMKENANVKQVKCA